MQKFNLMGMLGPGLLTLTLFGSGCSSTNEGRQLDGKGYWNGDKMAGIPSIRIDLSDQRAYLFKGGKLAGMSHISSGREGLGTVTGSFRLLEKDKEHASSLYGSYVSDSGEVIRRDVNTREHTLPAGAHYRGADMPYWMRIVGGTGMHAGYLPGYPASHGCIRMPLPMAEVFFHAVSVGTPVTIEQ